MTGKRITPPTREERRVRRCRRAVIRALTVVTVLAVMLLAGYILGRWAA